MSDALVILNARDIEVAKRSVDELRIGKIWLRGWTEGQLADGVFADAIEESGHDRFFVVADDVIVRQHALAAVQLALSGGWDVVTGYSQHTHTDFEVNINPCPLAAARPVEEAYDFCHIKDVISHPDPIFRTWFAGMSMTGMSLEMWRRFPFGCYVDEGSPRGYASDFHLSWRLQQAGVPIGCVREGFAYHWRHEWKHTNHPDDDRVLVGEIKPEVIFE